MDQVECVQHRLVVHLTEDLHLHKVQLTHLTRDVQLDLFFSRLFGQEVLQDGDCGNVIRLENA